MLVALNSIAGQQANLTKKTAKAVVKLLNYCAINPNAVIRYRASKMVLNIHSDASFMLVEEAAVVQEGTSSCQNHTMQSPHPNLS
eukprot:11930471-Ditylum_brightwellii.AAC.1